MSLSLDRWIRDARRREWESDHRCEMHENVTHYDDWASLGSVERLIATQVTLDMARGSDELQLQ